MTIIELRAKRSKAWEAAKAFAETHTNSNGVLSAEDTQTYEKMEQEIIDLGKEIQRRERQEALDAELNMPVNKPLTSSPANAEKPKTGRASNEYKEGFGRHLRGKKPISPRASTQTAVTSSPRNLKRISFAVLMKRTLSVPSPRSSPPRTTEKFLSR